jgi:hypothetical protein
VDGLVVLVAGHAVRAERDDGVRGDDVDDVGEVLHDHVVGRGRARAVGEAQQVVLGDTQCGERRVQLALPHLGHPVGRPAAGVVGAMLAEGGGDADHALACVAGRGHEPCGQEGLVIGVGPDAEHRAELGDVGDRAGRGDR